MYYGMFDKVDSIRSHLPGLILNVIRSHYTKFHEKEASAKEKKGGSGISIALLLTMPDLSTRVYSSNQSIELEHLNHLCHPFLPTV